MEHGFYTPSLVEEFYIISFRYLLHICQRDKYLISYRDIYPVTIFGDIFLIY